MGRFNRVVALDVPHHVTQRGNGRRFVLYGDADRTIYLKLLRENIVLYGVTLIGYCLMSNHIHLIAIPHKVDGLAQALKQTHGRYASYWNAAHQSNGHVWQGRYYSCPLDQSHLWEALRYTELSCIGRPGLSFAWVRLDVSVKSAFACCSREISASIARTMSFLFMNPPSRHSPLARPGTKSCGFLPRLSGEILFWGRGRAGSRPSVASFPL
jgi:REP element-mobilizing transposase RayT